MSVQTLLPILQMVLAFGNICVLGYALMNFLKRPHDTLETKVEELKKRVDTHDLKFKEVEDSLRQGNDKFRKQDELNEVFINCMLAFIDFEMAYCSATGFKDTEDLESAKTTLRKYLAKR